MLTIKDIAKLSASKKDNHKELYQNILETIYKKIKLACQNNRKYLMYTFRPIIPGYPIYNIHHACEYAARKLKKGGFQVECDYTNYIIHVYWS